MIDEEITFREKGYRSTDLSHGSHKEVWRVCDDCGDGKWAVFQNCYDLCIACAMKKRRKYNYDGLEDVVRSIDEEKTFREKGYRTTDLSAQSHKEVYAVCVECGTGRWLDFCNYKDLCFLCKMKNKPTQKCETPTEKLPWIDEEKTYAEKGYRSTDLKPSSHMPVWRVCAGCGEGMWIIFKKCGSLCKKCSNESEEHRMNMSESQKGEKSHNWKGGISFEPYCEKFNNALKESVREKFGRVCFMCPTTEEENGRKLDVHHVNYDKECMCNDVECEFVPLCRKCHGRTCHDHELWERLIINTLSYEGWI